MKNYQSFRNLISTLLKRSIEDRLFYSASALTFASILALVPLISICLSILSTFPVFHHLRNEIQSFIFQNLLPESSAALQPYFQGFVRHATELSSFGIVTLIITAIAMILTTEKTLNNIWKINPRQGISAWLRYWAIITLTPVFMSLSIAATTHIISSQLVVETATFFGFKNLLFQIVSSFLTFTAFTLLYVFVPNCKVPFRYGIIGALIATIILAITKNIFVFYVTHLTIYELIYGTLAAVPIFLIWIYFVWVIVLFGALISNILTTQFLVKKLGDIDPFTHAFLWLGYLWHAHQQGKGLTLNQLHRLVPGYYKVEAYKLINTLRKLKLIQMTNRNEYILSRDLSNTTVADLYRWLPWKFEVNQVLPEKIKNIFTKADKSMKKTLDLPLKELYQTFFEKR